MEIRLNDYRLSLRRSEGVMIELSVGNHSEPASLEHEEAQAQKGHRERESL